MDAFGHSEVERLSGVRDPACVSIYLPTHRTGEEMQQDPIRLKNLLAEAEGQLLAAGHRRPNVVQWLAPARELFESRIFWQYQSDGLALFLAPGFFERYRVPLRFDEVVVVADRFHQKPLFPFLTGDGHFFILALSQNEVRLLEATRHAVDSFELEDLPRDLAAALGPEEPERQLQFHTRAAPGGGQRAAVFHGHGGGGEDDKQRILKYFRRIEAPLGEFLKQHRSPLVLAGVEYYFPMFREVSRSPRIVEGGVAGNPETLRMEELHRRAWPLVEPLFDKDRQAALAKYRQGAGTGRTSSDIAVIVPAVEDGRVDVLFVATDRNHWGVYDAQARRVVPHEAADASNEDLLDRAAIGTYLRDGTVYAVPASQIPEGASAAAIFRY